MNETQLGEILEEVKGEISFSPFLDDNPLENYIKSAEYDINGSSGELIDYDKDLDARSLLKNYVFYAYYKKLAEFKEIYGGEYAKLQIKYYKPADILWWPI